MGRGGFAALNRRGRARIDPENLREPDDFERLVEQTRNDREVANAARLEELRATPSRELDAMARDELGARPSQDFEASADRFGLTQDTQIAYATADGSVALSTLFDGHVVKVREGTNTREQRFTGPHSARDSKLYAAEIASYKANPINDLGGLVIKPNGDPKFKRARPLEDGFARYKSGEWELFSSNRAADRGQRRADRVSESGWFVRVEGIPDVQKFRTRRAAIGRMKSLAARGDIRLVKAEMIARKTGPSTWRPAPD